MPTDIFPEINIPVVSVIWTYSGVSPEEMAEVITVRCERAFTVMVNDIDHIESQSLPGLAVIRVYFHPNARIDAAVAQMSAASQSVLKSLPTGMTPPNIIRYNASSVPILQLGISSDMLTEQQLYDLGYNFIRTQLANVQGASFPLPYGGKPRQVSVDLNPQALYAQGLSANDVVDAINAQSLILPSGTVKIGARRIHRADEQRARRGGGVQPAADPADRTAPRYSWATWRKCATATRCRPTSCGTTGRGRRC